LIDCTIIRPHSKWYGIILGFKLFTKKISNNNFISCLQENNYTIDFKNPAPIHIDGEAEKESSKSYTIKALPMALNIIYP
jgi:diacylglycerol kinase family enzyme